MATRTTTSKHRRHGGARRPDFHGARPWRTKKSVQKYEDENHGEKSRRVAKLSSSHLRPPASWGEKHVARKTQDFDDYKGDYDDDDEDENEEYDSENDDNDDDDDENDDDDNADDDDDDDDDDDEDDNDDDDNYYNDDPTIHASAIIDDLPTDDSGTPVDTSDDDDEDDDDDDDAPRQENSDHDDPSDDDDDEDEGEDHQEELELGERLEARRNQGMKRKASGNVETTADRKRRALEIARSKLNLMRQGQPQKKKEENQLFMEYEEYEEEDEDESGDDEEEEEESHGGNSKGETTTTTTEKKKKKRVRSKNAPTEVSSKRSDFLRRRRSELQLDNAGLSVSIASHVYKPRDPRALLPSSEALSIDQDVQEEQFAFLAELQSKEMQTLKERIKARKLTGRKGKRARRKLGITDGSTNETDEAELRRLQQAQDARRAARVQRVAKRGAKSKLRQAVLQGERAPTHFPTRAEMKRLEAEAKFEHLSAQKGGKQAIQKAMERKRRRNASRDRKRLGMMAPKLQRGGLGGEIMEET